MASAPPDTENDDRNEEALALLLLLGARRYDLRALIRSAKVKPRPFRQIKPTEALASDLAAPYFTIVRAWDAEIDDLIAAYTRGGTAELERALGEAAIRVNRVTAIAGGRFPIILANVERWHRGQWVSRIRAATTIDVSTLSHTQEVDADVAQAGAWNRRLAEDVAAQTHHGIATALFVGLAAALPAAEARSRAREVIQKARRRAANIGVDQVDRTSRAMDRARATAAGLARFRWHHTHQLHPRPEHRRRDGRIYTHSTAPNDRAGTLPFCKCWEEPLFD